MELVRQCLKRVVLCTSFGRTWISANHDLKKDNKGRVHSYIEFCMVIGRKKIRT